MDDQPTETVLETSADGLSWTILADMRDLADGRTHRYLVLDTPLMHRYIRLSGYRQPFGSRFAVSGIRVFGHRKGTMPAVVTPSAARVGPMDAEIGWTAVADADGYNVRYGLQHDRLYSSWMVRDADRLRLSSLNAGEDYWIAVDSFNGGSVTRSLAVRVPGSGE